MADSTCSVEDCDGRHKARGYCSMHYAQVLRGGEPKPSRWALERVCVVCGDDVPRGTGRRKHCSHACQAMDSRHKGARPTVATCALCAAEFPLGRGSGGRFKRTDTLFCGDCGRDSPESLRFKRYGIVPEDYLAALAAGCEICGAHPDRLHVDHDHSCCPGRTFRTCGKCVRGFLCGPCNRALGMLKDSVESLESAIGYLKRHG